MKAPEIAHLLNERIDQIVADLLPGGRREGHEWRCGSIAGEPGHSLGVHLVGAKRGIWADFSTDQKGDALDLVRAVLGMDTAAAIAWSRRWLGIDELSRRRDNLSWSHHAEVASLPAPDQDELLDSAAAEGWSHKELRVEGEPGRPALRTSSPVRVDTGAEARQTRALDIWRSAAEDISDTPAETYLRSRGLDPARLCSLHDPGRWPATLRYSERAAFDPTVEYRALVVAVHGADCGLVRAVQRVLLHADGSAVRDERGRRRKLSLGPIRGNAAMGDYWPDPRGRWGLAEGVETALAAYAQTGIPTWAAISAGNMPNIAPPSWARHITLFADRDGPGLAAAGKARRRLHSRIDTVRIVAAATDGDDALDVLAGGGNG